MTVLMNGTREGPGRSPRGPAPGRPDRVHLVRVEGVGESAARTNRPACSRDAATSSSGPVSPASVTRPGPLRTATWTRSAAPPIARRASAAVTPVGPASAPAAGGVLQAGSARRRPSRRRPACSCPRVGRGHLPDAVPHHLRRPHAPRRPQLGQPDLDGEDRRLAMSVRSMFDAPSSGSVTRPATSRRAGAAGGRSRHRARKTGSALEYARPIPHTGRPARCRLDRRPAGPGRP